MNYRPYALLAEVTYQCPLHCPYCSNPTRYPQGAQLDTDQWRRIINQAAALGVLQAGFSGGEPLVRSDLTELIESARDAGLYTNLLTSGLGLSAARAKSLRAAGLDSLQLSFQADTAERADAIAGTRAHTWKLDAARVAREEGLALSMNVVLHRRNIERLPQIIALAEALKVERIELANTQFYGWAFANRSELLPTREQVLAAREVAVQAKQRFAGRMEIFYVLPDYYEARPKPCMQGWGRRYITVNPVGDVLPCPTAGAIPGLRFENVRNHALAWIWNESESFNAFRGDAWMREPCRSCPNKEVDYGGCRCQAALLTGDSAAADPVCALSENRAKIDEVLAALPEAPALIPTWSYRQNPLT